MLKKKIINNFLINGNKRTSEKIFFRSLKSIQHYFNKNSKNILKFSLIKISSLFDIKQNKRKKRVLTEIPFLLRSSVRISTAIKQIVKITSYKKESACFFLFRYELVNSLTENNEILKEKSNFYKKAFAKKAFTHFRWF